MEGGRSGQHPLQARQILVAGETIDLKTYEADMRHLIDTEEPRKISPFDKMSLLELIVKTGIADAINNMPKGIRANRNAIAETIENNVRRVIIKERLNDPDFYERMSALLNEIIAARKARAIEYEEYLKRIGVFAISKLGWIKQQRREILAQERETDREYLNRESHYVWGKRYLLKVVEKDAAPTVNLRHSQILLQIRLGASADKREAILEDWYRAQLKAAAQPLIAKWEELLGVQVQRLFVQRMKTKWGSCSPGSQSIRLNTELGKKPPECLEYIIVHEMAHLLEPTHNGRFTALLDHFLPHWRYHRETLNRLPLRHENWKY